ncbi:ATP-binding protein [Angustibacter aerolatus]
MSVSVSSRPLPALDVVTLDVPADPAYVAVVRTAAAGLAARADLTLDRIEDLRIAVDEACAMLLGRRLRGGDRDIHCVFTLEETSLTVELTGPDVQLPDASAFAWAVLEALVDSLGSGSDVTEGEPTTWVRLAVRGGTGSWG